MTGKTTKSKASPSRQTVASVAAELAALKDRVAALEAEVAALGGHQASAVAAGAATVAPAAAKDRPAGVVPDDPMADVHGLMRQIFTLATAPLPEDPDARQEQFDAFVELVHSDRRGSATLNQSLRNYTWAQLRHKADIYLRDLQDAGSYTVVRSSPDELSPVATRIKLFLKARTRMPTPISLRRDASAQDAWRIESSSL